MVQEQLEICPQFEQCIHSVFNKDDLVPPMFGCLSLDSPNLSSLSVPQPAEAKALVAPSNGSPRSPERQQVYILACINYSVISFISIPYRAVTCLICLL